MTKLDKLLEYVSKHNDFYKSVIQKNDIKDPLDITHYPVITRQQLQENRYKMFSEGGDLAFYEKNLLRRQSSGTSGIPINVYWEYDHYYASIVPLWRMRKKYYNISPNCKRVSFTYTDNKVKNNEHLVYQCSDTELLIMCSSLTDSNAYMELINLIDKFQPEWIYVQPSVLNSLIDHYEYFKSVPPNTLRYIETVGEMLSDSIRQKALSFFKTTIANMYGSEEMNAIAYECPFHNMHVINDNVYVECADEDGVVKDCGTGSAIITNLNNKIMPLIRYNQGDIITIKHHGCDCGEKTLTISNIMGRTRNSFKINDRLITPFTLVRIIGSVNNQLRDVIKKFCFDYHMSQNKFECKLWVEESYISWKRKIEALINEKLQEVLGSAVDIIININVINDEVLCVTSKASILNIHS